MQDALFIGLLFVGMPLVIIAFASWLLHYFVALNSPPTQRAAWTVGIAYVIASAFWLFGDRRGTAGKVRSLQSPALSSHFGGGVMIFAEAGLMTPKASSRASSLRTATGDLGYLVSGYSWPSLL